GAREVWAGRRGVRLVGGEEGADLVGRRPALEAGELADQLQVREVAGRQLVVAPLAVEGQLLERPRADPADRAEAHPGRLVVGEVDPAGGHLAAGADQRAGAAGGEVARLELGLGAAGEHGGRRRIAEAPARALAAEAPGERALDPPGPLGLDELLGDRPRERLERLRAPLRADPGLAADHRAEQRIAPEA